jgi:hypothetical protein
MRGIILAVAAVRTQVARLRHPRQVRDQDRSGSVQYLP